VTNNANAAIMSAVSGIYADTGFANVTNAGRITGTINYGIYAGTNATVTNNAGANIAGGQYGIYAVAGGSSVFNAGTISGGAAAIAFAGTGNTLTLAQGSIISGNVLGTGRHVPARRHRRGDVRCQLARSAVSGFWDLQQDRQLGLDTDRHQRPVNVNSG
jgi:hypothetical protein